MRTFMSHPTLSADWKGDYEEKSAEWFELFLDLMMVAAFSNVAEKLKEDLTFEGTAYFFVLTSMYTVSWTLYTSFHARFNEKSLLHYFYLYIWLVGLGGMILAGEPGVTFTIGLVLIRVSQMLMYLTVYFLLPHVRCNTFVDLFFGASSLVILLLTLVLPTSWTIPAYCVVAFNESIGRFIAALRGWFLREGHVRVPMNINHFNERVGCLVMVALGEAVVSAVINFKNPAQLTSNFFFMMQLALVVIFSTAMFYFTIQPPREYHAMRRSAISGIIFSWLHLLLYPVLLGIGVSLKFISGAVLTNTSLESKHAWLLFGSIAAGMVIMLCIRLTHFGGRQPSPTDPDHVKQIKYAWWAVIGVSPIFPLACAYVLHLFSGDSINPMNALIFAAVFNVTWVLIESAMMNRLVELGYGTLGEVDENTPLVETRGE